jgi:predicted ABC-type transport system involved in lysophospholipase L1 biosynthesis ATPase subunit
MEGRPLDPWSSAGLSTETDCQRCQGVAIDRKRRRSSQRPALADEPTGNLNPQTAKEIVDLILKMAGENGATLVIVTYDDRLARRLDRTLSVEAGRLVEDSEAVA